MNRYHFRIYVGPTLVHSLSEKFKQAGLEITCEGTEHLHVRSDGSDKDAAFWNLCADLIATHGTDYGIRNPVILN